MKAFFYLRRFFLFILKNHFKYWKFNITLVEIRDGPDIRFSIRYPAKYGHFIVIRYPAGYRISKTGYPVSEYPAGYPANRILVWYFYSCLKIWDVSIIWVTLSNNEQALKYPVSGRISGRISGIRHPPDIRPDIRYPVFKMAGYPVGRISGKTAIRSIPRY